MNIIAGIAIAVGVVAFLIIVAIAILGAFCEPDRSLEETTEELR